METPPVKFSTAKAAERFKSGDWRAYALVAYLGVAAGIVVGVRIVRSTQPRPPKPKPCPCEEPGAVTIDPKDPLYAEKVAVLWSAFAEPWPGTKPHAERHPGLGDPVAKHAATQSPAPVPTMPAPGPVVAETPPDFIEPAGPLVPTVPAPDTAPDPSLGDAFARFHMGDNGAYDGLATVPE